MVEIAVVGEPQFTMGFRLAGIRKVVEIEDLKEAEGKVKDIFKAEGVGIIITSPAVMAAVSKDMHQLMDASFSPVSVVVSGKDEMGNLREAIKKAIGVDLWK